MKYKARMVAEQWPWPRSFTVQPAWNPGSPYDLAYHAEQAHRQRKFLADPDAVKTLRLSIQRTDRRKMGIFFGEWGILHAYPDGGEIIQFGLCGMNLANPMGCFFCAYGHMMECHFPRNCKEAECSHLWRYDAEVPA